MRLYNTPTKTVVDIDAPNEESLKLYTCGPTVYDYPHIGNWYTFIRYDLLNRVLLNAGYQTRWIMNITDVGHLVSDADEGEDKLEKGARRDGKTAWDVAEFYGNYFLNALKRLNFSDITKITKATDYIDEQIELIKKLEEKGLTYKTTDGVYFDTVKFPTYADFAHLKLDAQEEGARVEANLEKHSPSDFALWKLSPKDSTRDMEWDSPWGKGFPGWHLECSAMIHAELGEPIDIHAGGIDHIPVHHTNEIAQSEAAFESTLAKIWMHCNFINVNGEKMAKSAGSFMTLEDIEKQGYSLSAFRLHVLSGHYRNQSEFNLEGLAATQNRLQRWLSLASMRWQLLGNRVSSVDRYIKELSSLLEDDLNTPAAVALADEFFSTLGNGEGSRESIETVINHIDVLFGLNIAKDTPDISNSEREAILKIDDYRSQKNFEKADSLKAELEATGLPLRFEKDKTYWSRTV